MKTHPSADKDAHPSPDMNAHLSPDMNAYPSQATLWTPLYPMHTPQTSDLWPVHCPLSSESQKTWFEMETKNDLKWPKKYWWLKNVDFFVVFGAKKDQKLKNQIIGQFSSKHHKITIKKWIIFWSCLARDQRNTTNWRNKNLIICGMINTKKLKMIQIDHCSSWVVFWPKKDNELKKKKLLWPYLVKTPRNLKGKWQKWSCFGRVLTKNGQQIDCHNATPLMTLTKELGKNPPPPPLLHPTTHNSIISTARSWRPLRKKTFPIFLIGAKKYFLPRLIYLRISHPTDPPRDALQHPPRGGPALQRDFGGGSASLALLRCTYLDALPSVHSGALNTVQHTAAHCITVQHTASHCITCHHTATNCNTLRHASTHCAILRHSATHCNAYALLQLTAIHCNAHIRILEVSKAYLGSIPSML